MGNTTGQVEIVEPLLTIADKDYAPFLDLLKGLKDKGLGIVTGRAFALACHVANEHGYFAKRSEEQSPNVKYDPLCLFYNQIGSLKDRVACDSTFEDLVKAHKLATSLHSVRQYLADNHWPVHRDNLYHLLAASFVGYHSTGEIVTHVFQGNPRENVRPTLVDSFTKEA